jgi:hypothetical protein
LRERSVSGTGEDNWFHATVTLQPPCRASAVWFRVLTGDWLAKPPCPADGRHVSSSVRPRGRSFLRHAEPEPAGGARGRRLHT